MLRGLARRIATPRLLSKTDSSTRSRGIFVSAAELQFGQPVHETHPHLLEAGEVTPGITALEYATRRARLAERLPEGGVAVLRAANLKYRSGAVFHEYHQNSDFFYLTGFNEPDALALIEKIAPTGQADHVFHLYVRPKNPREEQWEGARSGIQAAEDVFNADKAGDISSMRTELPRILKQASQVFADTQQDTAPRSVLDQIFDPSRTGSNSPQAGLFKDTKIQALRPMMNHLRVMKSDAEIEIMRLVGKASGRVFTAAMSGQWHQQGRAASERDLWGFLRNGFIRNGLDGEAYVPVVAGGENALSIHYVRNDSQLLPIKSKENSLVLVDAGGEYGGYITDITRTWPVDGTFTAAQKDLYLAVLDVQRSCLSLCRQDANVSLDKLHNIAERGLKDNLKGLGFDTSGDAMDVLFPHHVGHHIGLDVHDAPGYPRTENLKAGNCITIEPGLYIPQDERWPEAFRGMGIRIEDSVAVQETTSIILTTEAVKEIADFEALQ